VRDMASFRIRSGRSPAGTDASLFLRTPEFEVKCSSGEVGAGLDVLAVGGYIIGACLRDSKRFTGEKAVNSDRMSVKN
jgi:hypothetical protein